MPQNYTLRMLTPRRRQTDVPERSSGGPQARLLTQLPEVTDRPAPPIGSVEQSDLEAAIVACLAANRQPVSGSLPCPEEGHASSRPFPSPRLERWIYRGGGLVSIAILLYLACLNLQRSHGQLGEVAKAASPPEIAASSNLLPASDFARQADVPTPVLREPKEVAVHHTLEIDPRDYPSTGWEDPLDQPLESESLADSVTANTPAQSPAAIPANADYEAILNPQNALPRKYRPAQVGLARRLERITR